MQEVRLGPKGRLRPSPPGEKQNAEHYRVNEEVLQRSATAAKSQWRKTLAGHSARNQKQKLLTWVLWEAGKRVWTKSSMSTGLAKQLWRGNATKLVWVRLRQDEKHWLEDVHLESCPAGGLTLTLPLRTIQAGQHSKSKQSSKQNGQKALEKHPNSQTEG